MTTISGHPGAHAALTPDHAIDEAPEALDVETNFDPRNNPGIKDMLRQQASWLHMAARQWPGADDLLRAQTQALSEWANELRGDPRASAGQLQSLHRTLALLPEGLRHVAAHLDAFAYDQRELARLSAALDRTAGSAHRHGISEPRFAEIRATAQRIASAIDTGRANLMAGRMQELRDNVNTVEGSTASLRGLLERTKILRPDDRLPETLHPEPNLSAARRRGSPAMLLSGVLARAVHTAKSARNAFIKQVSPQQRKEAKLADMARRQLALAPLREELSLLEDDLSGAELRVGVLRIPPVRPNDEAKDRAKWADDTLSPILKKARRTEAAALRALARRSKPEAVTQQAIAKIRSQLTAFNAALDGRREDTKKFKFLHRPWPPVAGGGHHANAA